MDTIYTADWTLFNYERGSVTDEFIGSTLTEMF